MNGIYAVATERARQMTSEGYTAEHDADHDCGELMDAALAYLEAARRVRDYLAELEMLSSPEYLVDVKGTLDEVEAKTIISAAAATTPVDAVFGTAEDGTVLNIPEIWPFEASGFKPQNTVEGNLVKAAALSVAELDRLASLR